MQRERLVDPRVLTYGRPHAERDGQAPRHDRGRAGEQQRVAEAFPDHREDRLMARERLAEVEVEEQVLAGRDRTGRTTADRGRSRRRMASIVADEMAGFSAIWFRKSPGASCSSRNVSAEIPRSSGMICRNRRMT